MRVAGLLLMVSGWALMLTSLVLLPPSNARAGFLSAGCGLIVLGLVLALRSGSTLPGVDVRERL